MTKNNNNTVPNKKKGFENKTRNLTYGSLMIALVLISTYAIKIPVPFTQGYIHAGDSMIFIAALLFGWRFGALAGGIGSTMADLLGGYAHWAIPTLIIKTLMGAFVGWVGHDLPKKENYRQISALLVSGATILWFAFCFGMKVLLSQVIHNSPAVLLGQMPEVATLNELATLVEKVEFLLTLTAIALPIGLIAFSFYLKKTNQEFFGITQLFGMFLAGLWMVIGYYIAAGFIYGSFIVPIFSIPSDIIQFLGGLGIAYLIIIALKRAKIIDLFL